MNIFATNTSGIPLSKISEDFSDDEKKRFLGCHFFNPPRYLKLLELIPTEYTDPAVLNKLAEFGRVHLGKGIVVAKDTPNFIGNRIGCYAMQVAVQAYFKGDYSIEEIDALTGPILGRPKSATFRTMDVVGIDTMLYVCKNLYELIPHDECREVFKAIPEVVKLVEMGRLGAKVKAGFYKKVGKDILSLNLENYEYEAPKAMNLPGLDDYKKVRPLTERVKALYNDDGRVGSYIKNYLLSVLSYSARRIPEIADSVDSIDKATRWGFGWEIGPFEIWDALGVTQVITDMEEAGFIVPDWVKDIDPDKGFYANIETKQFADEYLKHHSAAENHNPLCDVST